MHMDITEKTAEKKKRPGIRTLTSPGDVSRLLARLIKQRLADDGSIDNETLRAIVNACGVLLKSIEAADLDDRLAEIESRLDEAEQEAAARR
jgi:hypothetical protein